MKRTSDEGLEIAMAPAEECRVAYSLDGRQPVRCSIIGDQPLFYMDFSDAGDGDGFDDGFGFAAIEKSLTALREKIAALDKAAPDATPAATALARFHEDAAALTRVRKPNAALPSPKTLEVLLRQSRFAAALLDLGANYGPVLRYSRQQPGAAYDRRCGTIFIHPDLALADQILLAARELRRLWQHRNGALLHPLIFHPDQAILVNRAQVADLSVAMVRIAWELQLAGEKDAWLRLDASSMGDLARAFARESYMDFRSLNNGSAAAAVFETWFLSERCRREDRRLIQQMLADYSGYVFGNAQTSQTLTGELIIALGTMPFGKNYLAPYAQTVVKDAVFTEVRDRSNANFLWFIKFERSYRDTEAEQKSKTPPPVSLAPPDQTPTDKPMTNAQIIPLPRREAPKARRRKNGVGMNAEIIAFRRP